MKRAVSSMRVSGGSGHWVDELERICVYLPDTIGGGGTLRQSIVDYCKSAVTEQSSNCWTSVDATFQSHAGSSNYIT